MDDDHTISKYDRLYGALRDVCMPTKQSTVTAVDLTGRAETFIVQTLRHEENGDYVFVQRLDEDAAAVRLALPPKVANAIAAQRDSLTTRRRRITSKRLANERKSRGELPGFMRKKA